jgi:hypothetical protein
VLGTGVTIRASRLVMGPLWVPNTRPILSWSPVAIDSPIPARMDNPIGIKTAIIRMDRWVWPKPQSRTIRARASKKIRTVNEPKALVTLLPAQCFTPGMPVIRSQTWSGHPIPHPSIGLLSRSLNCRHSNAQTASAQKTSAVARNMLSAYFHPMFVSGSACLNIW